MRITMGQHNFVATVELPNDESAMSILLALGVRGNVRTTTLKAFSFYLQWICSCHR